LPTPDFFAIDGFDDLRWQGGQLERTSALSRRTIDWPVIVKSGNQDASIGIDQGSVVTSDAELAERVALILERYGPPVLVEQFIDGREMTVCVVELPELRALPVSEFVFKPRADNAWRIVTYDAKWHVDSRDFELTPYAEVATVANGLREKLHDLSLRAYRLLGIRDYGRVDFRVTRTGKPYILEANPNPDLAPAAGLVLAMEYDGTPFAQLVPQLVEQALARGAGVAQARLEPVN
jgi:D-alanine-D-alanine ligase